MNPELSLSIQALAKFPVYMTKEKVAEALGIATHNIPPLVRAKLLKPLGNPKRYCVKRFSRDDLARNITSHDWLEKVAEAIHRHCVSKMHASGRSCLKLCRQFAMNRLNAPARLGVWRASLYI